MTPYYPNGGSGNTATGKTQNGREVWQMKMIERKEYLDWLIRWKEHDLIKVVSGVRRSGKSTLFELFREYLLNNGLEEGQIISINFEDIENESLLNYRSLHDYVAKLLTPDKMNYVFLDEIQHVEQFEKAVISLLIKKNCDVYITGSNAYFMSGELATLLSGRYVELKILPLSFKEFCEGFDEGEEKLTKTEKFTQYLEQGSFPYSLKFSLRGREAREYMRDIYNTVLLKDVVARLKIADITSLENVAKFLLHNLGGRVSATKISNTLKTEGRGVDRKTIDKYIKGLCDSMIIYETTKYNIKGKEYLSSPHKYYCVDIALRNMLVGGKESDIGHILENIVFLELTRREEKVFTGNVGDKEVDFVTVKGNNDMSYYQVAATVIDENVLRRELEPLKNIKDHYPKYILTLDDIGSGSSYDGIMRLNIIDWLLSV